MKTLKWRKLALLAYAVGMILGMIPSHAQGTLENLGSIQNKPDSTTNPFILRRPGTEPNQVLPKALAQYAPSGSFLSRWGFGAAGTPPNPSAVDTVVLGLMNASMGESQLSKGIWGFTMALIFFGVTLSGFITFKAISAGKEPPGLGSVKWLGKTMLCILLVHFVAGAVAPTLIAICDSIGDEAGQWVSSNEKDVPSAIAVLANRIALGYGTQITAYMEEVKQRIFTHFENDPETRSKVLQGYAQGSNAVGQIWGNARREMLEIGEEKDKPADLLSQMVSDRAKKANGEALDKFEEIMKNTLASVQGQNITEYILATPTIDLTGLAYPVKIIRTAIYIAVVYISISIWGMPIAVLMWAGIFSLPSQWGMNNILYSGIKVILTVILSMILVMVYTAATLSAEQEKIDKAWTDYLPYIMQGPIMGTANVAVDIGGKIFDGKDTSIFSLIGVLGSATTDLIIASMLIITAPAQAAAIIKGANGAAESAKNSMMAGGSAYGSKQALDGIVGPGFSGGSSLGGGMAKLSSFQQNMGPSR